MANLVLFFLVTRLWVTSVKLVLLVLVFCQFAPFTQYSSERIVRNFSHQDIRHWELRHWILLGLQKDKERKALILPPYTRLEVFSGDISTGLVNNIKTTGKLDT